MSTELDEFWVWGLDGVGRVQRFVNGAWEDGNPRWIFFFERT